MKRKDYWTIVISFILVFFYFFNFFNTNNIFLKYLSVFIIAEESFLLTICFRNIYTTKKVFKNIEKFYLLLTRIHKTRYLSYFENNPDKTKDLSELFQTECDAFITILTDDNLNKLLKPSHPKYALIDKMLKKANEMKENAFIADYSI